jgi:Cu(I)/Ag(I) efflux system membrane protein CusA/SilA
VIARLIEWCARHRGPVFLLTALALVVAGYALRNVPLDAIPDLSDPQVIVFTEWMGRSPDLVEDQVTYPIVASLLSAPRVEAVRGQSMFGMSFVYVIFEEGTDLYWARSRIMEYLGTMRDRLPQGVTPTLGPDASSVGWAFQYALIDRSGRHDLADLRAHQDFQLRYALASVPGVAEVASVGGYERQYQVEVDPTRLHAHGLSLADVSAAIRRSNAEVGGRVIEMAGREYFVRGRGYVKSLDDLRQVALGADRRSGTPIRVADVAKVAFGPDIRRGVGEFEGQGEAVGGTVVVRYGENVLQVVERVKARIEELRPSLPPGVELRVVYDRSDLIHRAIHTLREALQQEMLVVSLVIFLFLLSFRSTLVPVITLPVAVVLSFIPMWLLRISSNIMSLGGIAIAVGEMADAAIVLVENAHKRLETAPPGRPRTEVLIEAAKEVGPPIFFSLLVVTAAFLPIFALNGQAGRMFTPLAWTKTFAMAFAALVSVTLAPALLTLLVRGRVRPEREHPVSRALIAAYRPFAWVALKNPRITLAIGLAAILSAVPLGARLGSEFMPPLNEGDVLYMPTTFPNISVEEAKRYLQVQDRILMGFPEVETVFGKAGRAETATDPAPLSMVETVVKLKPREQWRILTIERWWSKTTPRLLHPLLRLAWPDRRRMTWEDLTAAMNEALRLPGWTNALTMPIKTRIDMLSTGIRTPIGVKVLGTDLDSIEAVGLQLERVLSRVPATRSVYSDRNTGGFYVDVVPDRAALARYGLTVGDVQDVVEAAVGGQPIEVTVEGRQRFSINVRYPREWRGSVERLRHALVPVHGPAAAPASSQEPGGPMGAGAGDEPPVLLASAGLPDAGPAGVGRWATPPGAHVPLGQIADVRVTTGPPMIRNEDGMLAGYVYVDVDAGQRDIGGWVEDARRRVAHELRLPAGTTLRWTGQYELMQKMRERMRVLVPLTLVLIVMLVWLSCRSWIQTAIVLVSVPFALVGSVWLMAILDYNLSTATWVALIALVGLATQTGLVMMVYLDASYRRWREEGRIRGYDDIVEATLDGSVQRVRPKLMTVATTVIGLLPLLWATGAGSDVMKRLAAPMIGGLVTSTFLTLEIIPVLYAWWRWREWQRLKARGEV